jgi:hypothetical protein
MFNRALLFALSLTAMGCSALFHPMEGDWELEVVDADDCTMELEIEQDGDELDGEAEVHCVLFFDVGGELWYYEMESDDADLTGDVDGDRFELVVSFYDDFYEEEIEIVLDGQRDGDDLEGDIEVDGEDYGDFEGSRD